MGDKWLRVAYLSVSDLSHCIRCMTDMRRSVIHQLSAFWSGQQLSSICICLSAARHAFAHRPAT